MREDKSVFVILINYNQDAYTLGCLNSILASTYDNLNILLVDNGSTEANFNKLSNEIPDDPRIQLLRIAKNIGYVGGVNMALSNALELSGDCYVLIMNNDTLIEKNAVKELVNSAVKYGNRAIVSGKVYHLCERAKLQYIGTVYTNKNWFKEYTPGKDEIDNGQYDTEIDRDMLDDIFWLFHINLVKEIGYYSTDFFLYAEQADYAFRAKNSGYRLIYTPGAKIWHKGSLTTGDGNRYAPSVNFWRKKSSVIFLYKHQKKLYFFLRIGIKLIKLAVLYIFHLLSKNDRITLESALVGMMYGLKWIINKKPDTGYNPYLK